MLSVTAGRCCCVKPPINHGRQSPYLLSSLQVLWCSGGGASSSGRFPHTLHACTVCLTLCHPAACRGAEAAGGWWRNTQGVGTPICLGLRSSIPVHHHPGPSYTDHPCLVKCCFRGSGAAAMQKPARAGCKACLFSRMRYWHALVNHLKQASVPCAAGVPAAHCPLWSGFGSVPVGAHQGVLPPWRVGPSGGQVGRQAVCRGTKGQAMRPDSGMCELSIHQETACVQVYT